MENVFGEVPNILFFTGISMLATCLSISALVIEIKLKVGTKISIILTVTNSIFFGAGISNLFHNIA